MQAEEHAAQVDIHHPIPIAFIEVEQGFCLGDTGIVDQNVDAAKAGNNITHHLLSSGNVADIDGVGQRYTSCLRQFVGRGCGRFCRIVGNDNGSPFLCQPGGNSFPDPAPGTGDNGNFVLES